MIINKIESRLIKSVSVMIVMFVLQLTLYHTGLYTHLQAQIVFAGSLFAQVIASLSACFFLGWFLIDIIMGVTAIRTSVNDSNFNKQAAKKKAA